MKRAAISLVVGLLAAGAVVCAGAFVNWGWDFGQVRPDLRFLFVIFIAVGGLLAGMATYYSDWVKRVD